MPAPPKSLLDLADRCAAIELLLVDVDGVLTDGVIAIDDKGVETKHFHVRDGSAFHLWKKAGKRAAILLGAVGTAAVDRRCGGAGDRAPVIQGASPKGGPFRALLRDLGLGTAVQVCYVGRRPGRGSIARAATPSAWRPARAGRAAARGPRGRFSSSPSTPGGRGAVREVVEVILKHQGIWDDIVDGDTGFRPGFAENQGGGKGDIFKSAVERVRSDPGFIAGPSAPDLAGHGTTLIRPRVKSESVLPCPPTLRGLSGAPWHRGNWQS